MASAWTYIHFSPALSNLPGRLFIFTLPTEKIASGHRSRTSTIAGTWNLLAIRMPAILVSGWALDPMITSGFPYSFAYFLLIFISPVKNEIIFFTRDNPFP